MPTKQQGCRMRTKLQGAGYRPGMRSMIGHGIGIRTDSAGYDLRLKRRNRL